MSNSYLIELSTALASIPLACPLDGEALVISNNRCICTRGHSYDIARQGYVNLLPVQLKASRNPGDSKSMVSARRSVLEQGHFATLADAVCHLLFSYLEQALALPADALLVDAGCGDGYYTAILAKQLAAHNTGHYSRQPPQVLGIDISKWSVKAAAKKYPEIAFAVATNKQLPVLRGSASIITSLFGFETWQPWSQLQRSDQLVLIVDAGPQHLIELRHCIYDEVRIHTAPEHQAAQENGYLKLIQKNITYNTQIESPEQLISLLHMTPHGHRANAESRVRIAKLVNTSITIDTVVCLFRRC